jgi:hypothetical protein
MPFCNGLIEDRFHASDGGHQYSLTLGFEHRSKLIGHVLDLNNTVQAMARGVDLPQTQFTSIALAL